MKKIIPILLIIAIILISCHKELESEMYDKISPTTFPKTADDVKAAVTSVYSVLRCDDWGPLFTAGSTGVNVWPELSTDIMTCGWGGSWTPLCVFGWPTENARGYPPTFDKYSYISRGTMTIDRIKDVEMSQDLKDRYTAEIKCIQSWLAYILYDLFGPIPIASLEVLKDPLNSGILERPTKEWMVEYISTGLREAADLLPVSYETQDWGRCTKGTALMALLKLYMHEKDWENAEQVAREIVALGYYELLPDYVSIFTKENQRNKEIIYAVPCNIDYGNMWQSSVLPVNFPTTNPNIQKWSGFRMLWSFYDTFESNDERLKVIISEYKGTDDIYYDRNNPGIYLDYGAVPVKYGEDPDQIGYYSTIDVIIFRYADVLLSLAEAIANKNGTPNQESIDLINAVRNRAGLSDLTLADYSDLTKFNKMILLERGHELFCEGGRRQDQIRHGTYIEFGKTIVGSQAADYKVLYPFPQYIIDEGKGKIVQNPGY